MKKGILSGAEVTSQQYGEAYVRAYQLTAPGLMNREQYGDAFVRGNGQVLRVLMARGARRDRAEELAQDAWLRCWERLDQLLKPESAVAWVTTAAIRLSSNNWKRESRLVQLQSRDAAPISEFFTILDLKIAAAQLPERQREVFDAVYFNEGSREDVARKFGISINAVDLRLSRARRTLRKKRMGGDNQPTADVGQTTRFGRRGRKQPAA